MNSFFSIVLNILWIIVIIYSIANLSMPHDIKEAYIYAFCITGCSLGLLGEIRDQIISKIKS